MLIKQAIKILLKEDPGIAALGVRLVPLVVPQSGSFPVIAWGRLNRKAEPILDGTKRAQRPVTDWFEFVSVAEGPGGDAISEDIDDALFELLDGWAGIISDDASPSDTLTITGIFLEKLSELYRDDLKQYATRSTYRVHSVRKQRS